MCLYTLMNVLSSQNISYTLFLSSINVVTGTQSLTESSRVTKLMLYLPLSIFLIRMPTRGISQISLKVGEIQ